MCTIDVNATVANNLKRIRENKKLSLEATANLTGVSKSMLGQIERGDVNPTISVLWKIANGLKVSFTSLVEVCSPEAVVIKGDEVAPLIEADGLYLNYPVFAFDNEKLFETYRILIQPNGLLQAQAHMQGTAEYITVFNGQVQIDVDEEAFLLGKGDSIKFLADVAHSYRNTGQDVAELSMLIYYNK